MLSISSHAIIHENQTRIEKKNIFINFPTYGN